MRNAKILKTILRKNYILGLQVDNDLKDCDKNLSEMQDDFNKAKQNFNSYNH